MTVHEKRVAGRLVRTPRDMEYFMTPGWWYTPDDPIWDLTYVARQDGIHIRGGVRLVERGWWERWEGMVDMGGYPVVYRGPFLRMAMARVEKTMRYLRGGDRAGRRLPWWWPGRA